MSDEFNPDTEVIMATADIVVAAIANRLITREEVPSFIQQTRAAIAAPLVTAAPAASAAELKPAVNPKRSVHDDFIICLEDGKKFKSLKRHIRVHYSLTPEQYREKWGLDPSYPMVAPNYASARSELARKMGLGRKRGAPAGAAVN